MRCIYLVWGRESFYFKLNFNFFLRLGFRVFGDFFFVGLGRGYVSLAGSILCMVYVGVCCDD